MSSVIKKCLEGAFNKYALSEEQRLLKERLDDEIKLAKLASGILATVTLLGTRWDNPICATIGSLVIISAHDSYKMAQSLENMPIQTVCKAVKKGKPDPIHTKMLEKTLLIGPLVREHKRRARLQELMIPKLLQEEIENCNTDPLS